jgi:hypothetical protein
LVFLFVRPPGHAGEVFGRRGCLGGAPDFMTFMTDFFDEAAPHYAIATRLASIIIIVMVDLSSLSAS